MQSPDAFRYFGYVRMRWRFVAASCLTAVVLATAVSLLLPRQYTATARILIESPAGADPRAAVAVSPIYLESLKTYEHFAGSDSLFQKAASRLQLRALLGNKPIESLKKSVLKVGLVHNTRILEVEATLPDAARAQALAQLLAEETVSMNRSLSSAGGQDLAMAGGTVSGENVLGYLDIRTGGTASGAIVSSGGLLTVSAGAAQVTSAGSSFAVNPRQQATIRSADGGSGAPTYDLAQAPASDQWDQWRSAESALNPHDPAQLSSSPHRNTGAKLQSACRRLSAPSRQAWSLPGRKLCVDC